MKLVKCSIKEIEGNYYAPTKYQGILQEFKDSDMDFARLEGFTNKTANSCASAINVSIQRYHIGGVKAISRKGNVYLMKIK